LFSFDAQLEAKLLLATILQQYAPRLLPGYRPVPHALITLRPRNGLPMILEKI
jgi:PHYB activation tagged suppressor 1